MKKSKGFLHNLIKPFISNSIRGQKDEDLEQLAAQEQKQFPFEILVSATRNFHENNKLGEGGFGPVFKGRLDDGREIAVKKLSQFSRQGKKEFITEAKLLARVQHKNVVNLLGYCVHGQEKLLVYEYVVNESLDKILFKNGGKQNVLDWNRRHDIIMGMAKGLLYLHEDAHSCIIHRDIKASNILLDDKWIPKIADFGLARLFQEDQTHVNTRVAGTNGYMAPEYVMHGRLSVKADVFSFGVVVLELISGQKNSTSKQDDCQNLLEWAYKLYKKGKSLEIVDPSLISAGEEEQESAIVDQISVCIQIGLLCTQSDPQLRPNMRRVVVMLSRKSGGTLEEPTRPGYPGVRYKSRRKTSTFTTTTTTAGTSGESSNSFNSTTTTTTNTATAMATATATAISTSASEITPKVPKGDPHGKRPME